MRSEKYRASLIMFATLYIILLGLTGYICLDLNQRFASALSCVPLKPPRESLEASAAVFTGKVVEITGNGTSRSVVFDVNTSWKGISDDKVVIVRGVELGYYFQMKEEYLVYALTNTEGNLYASACSRTNLVSDAQEDLIALGDGEDWTDPGRYDFVVIPIYWMVVIPLVMAGAFVIGLIWIRKSRRKSA